MQVYKGNIVNELSIILDGIGGDIHNTKIAKGWKITTAQDWEDPNEIPAVLMLIVSEVSEALEAFRDDDKDHFSEELADIFIRLVGLAHGMNIDLGEKVIEKIEKNKNREYKHGGKKI